MKQVCVRILFLAMFLISANAVAVGTEWFKVQQVLIWNNGQFKVYTDKASTNGLEGCTQTDNSLAVEYNVAGGDKLLSSILAAKVANLDVNAWVVGCCLTHNGLTSPCVSTFMIK